MLVGALKFGELLKTDILLLNKMAFLLLNHAMPQLCKFLPRRCIGDVPIRERWGYHVEDDILDELLDGF